MKTKIEIRRWRSKRLFCDANWKVVALTGQPQTFPDGTYWDGWETLGYFRAKKEAEACAVEAGV